MKHLVGISGGIDSQACAGWALEHFPKEDVVLLNSQAGRNEHSLTVEHVRWYSENVHPVIECVPLIRDLGNRGTMPGVCRDRRREYKDDDEMDFADLAYIKQRFPSSQAQFCTEHLKLAPQLRWIGDNALGLLKDGYDRYIGVRADESRKRADLPEKQWDDYFDCDLYRPLLTWTKQQCFDFVKGRGEKINPLYSMGFTRVGCAPCINSSKADIRLWAARAPEMIDKVRRWEEKLGRTFFAPCVPGMALNWVDEVVKWSRTEHGGKQVSLPFVENDAEAGSCVSKFGLCE